MPCCSGVSGQTSAGPPGTASTRASTSAWCRATRGKSTGDGPIPRAGACSASACSAADHRSAIAVTPSSVSTPSGHVSVAESVGPAAPSVTSALISRGYPAAVVGSARSPSAGRSGAGAQSRPPASSPVPKRPR